MSVIIFSPENNLINAKIYMLVLSRKYVENAFIIHQMILITKISLFKKGVIPPFLKFFKTKQPKYQTLAIRTKRMEYTLNKI